MITKWTNYQNVIESLKEKHEVVTSTSSLNFQDINHFKLYLKELIDIRKQLRILFKLELNILEQKQIISNIKKRCDNYKEDQAKMIQSITEKEMTHIHRKNL
jgi:hypothetical protein